MALFGIAVLLLSMFASGIRAQKVVNGQIFTPGIAIIDAPQPNTPLGGDVLHVAIDVSSDGQLQLPPYPQHPVSALYNITIFLSSYDTGLNFTVSNGTASAGNASLGQIMAMEPTSTVKHVNWVWPACLVGDGSPSGNSSRGLYNISIHQNFRLNGTDAYTIFDLPISVTNKIDAGTNRPACGILNNPMMSPAALNASADTFTRIPGTAIKTDGDGLSGDKPDATAGDGLGAGSTIHWKTAVHWIWIAVFGVMFAV